MHHLDKSTSRKVIETVGYSALGIGVLVLNCVLLGVALGVVVIVVKLIFP